MFGKRRFFACKDILHWDTIPCRIVDVSSILTGQYVENEARKDFTPSERDAIRRALEIEAGTRQGRRTDLAVDPSHGEKGTISGPQVAEREGENQPASEAGSETIPGGRRETTRDVTARAAGFASTSEARRVRKIMERGAPELIQAVDQKKISISVAERLADLPKPKFASKVNLRPTCPRGWFEAGIDLALRGPSGHSVAL